MKAALIALLVLHGALHVLGFVKGFDLAEVAALTQPMTRPVGALWLVAGLLFVTAAALLGIAPRWWWAAAVPAVVLSQALIVSSWRDARFGTIPNVLILVALVVSLGNFRR